MLSVCTLNMPVTSQRCSRHPQQASTRHRACGRPRDSPWIFCEGYGDTGSFLSARCIRTIPVQIEEKQTTKKQTQQQQNQTAQPKHLWCYYCWCRRRVEERVQDGCDTSAHKSRRIRPAHDLAYELARPQQVDFHTVRHMKVTHPLAAFSHAEEAMNCNGNERILLEV
jgi:hypothetical protein